MSSQLFAVSFSRAGVLLLRRLLDQGLRNVDESLVPDDVLAFADLLRNLDNGRQITTVADTLGADEASPVDDAPMSFKATAQRLNCSTRTVERMVERGELDTVLVGRRRRIPAAAVANKIRPGATSSTSGSKAHLRPALNEPSVNTRPPRAVKAGQPPTANPEKRNP